jgi:hypothetical protein
MIRSVSVIAAVLSLVTPRARDLPAQLLPVLGGSGGTSFTRDCGPGRVMTGLRYRTGTVVDALGLLCRPVASDGTLLPETTVGTLVGGGGGNSGTVSCPSGHVVVGAKMYYGLYVDGVALVCRSWVPSTRSWSSANGSVVVLGTSAPSNATETCGAAAQPAHAIRGRSGSFIDALGFTCDEP